MRSHKTDEWVYAILILTMSFNTFHFICPRSTLKNKVHAPFVDSTDQVIHYRKAKNRKNSNGNKAL